MSHNTVVPLEFPITLSCTFTREHVVTFLRLLT